MIGTEITIIMTWKQTPTTDDRDEWQQWFDRLDRHQQYRVRQWAITHPPPHGWRYGLIAWAYVEMPIVYLFHSFNR